MLKHCGTISQNGDLNYIIANLEVRIKTLSTFKGGKSILLRIDLAPSETLQLSSALKRRKLAIIPALTVITHKSQIQTSKHAGIYPEQPAMTHAKNSKSTKIFIKDSKSKSNFHY